MLTERSPPRLALLTASFAAAVIAASGVVETEVFHQPTTLKYALTIVVPLLVLVGATIERPLPFVAAIVVLVAPLADANATFQGTHVSPLVPLLVIGFALIAIAERRAGRPASLRLCALLAFPLLLLPLIDGGGNHELIVSLALMIAIAVLVGSAASDARGLRTVLVAIALQAAAQAAIGLWESRTGHTLNLYSSPGSTQYATNDIYNYGGTIRPTGTFPDPISLANVLAISVPVIAMLIVLARSWMARGALLIALALVGTDLGLALDRASWIGAVVGLALAIALTPAAVRRVALPFAAAGLAVVVAGALLLAGGAVSSRFDSLFNPTGTAGTSAQATGAAVGEQNRLALWDVALRDGFLAHPLAGIGIDNMGQLEREHTAVSGVAVRAGTAVYQNAASTYLQLLGDAGLFALALFALLAVTLTSDLRRALRAHPVLGAGLAGAVAAMAICWVFDVVVFYEPVAACEGVLLGAIAGAARVHYRRDQGRQTSIARAPHAPLASEQLRRRAVVAPSIATGTVVAGTIPAVATHGPQITRGTARMAGVASLRNVIQAALMALTAAVVARFLGARDFGLYAGGTAAFNLALSFTDLGFSLVVTREMARRPQEQGRLLRTTLEVQLAWSALIALGLAGLGLAVGGTRGEVMLVLSPGLAFAALGSSRQIFAVRYRARQLLALDLSTAVLQAGVMILLAVAHAGVVPIAGVLGVNWCVSGIGALLLARRAVAMPAPAAGERRQMLRLAIPLGLASLLASLYFTVDQLILSWLVAPRELGHYAAAVRLLSVVVMIPGMIMAAGIPGLAAHAGDRRALSSFAATLAHWIAITALPLCVALAVFAQPAIRIVFGGAYAQSAPLLRILMVAGVLSLISNVLGIVLSALSIVRPQLLFNVFALAVNVVGNVLLVPRFGVTASAWLTAACEAIVVSYGIVVLWRRLSFGELIRRVWRPACAVSLASAAGLLLGARDGVAVAGFMAVFALTTILLRAWPSELMPRRLHHALACP